MPMQSRVKFASPQNIFWRFTAEQRRRILLNNWIDGDSFQNVKKKFLSSVTFRHYKTSAEWCVSSNNVNVFLFTRLPVAHSCNTHCIVLRSAVVLITFWQVLKILHQSDSTPPPLLQRILSPMKTQFRLSWHHGKKCENECPTFIMDTAEKGEKSRKMTASSAQ